MSYNIAIDGPAGAGKSTIAKLVAKKRGYIYVDTGAMYRAMALYLQRTGVDTSDRAAIAKACQNADISIAYQKGEQVVLLNGENVNAYLRTEEVGNMASVFSAVPEVRKKLVELQQELAAKEDGLIRIIRIEEKGQILGNFCFIKGNTLFNNCLIDGIQVEKVQRVGTTLVAGNCQFVQAGSISFSSQLNRVNNIGFFSPTVGGQPRIWFLVLKSVFERLMEQTKMIPQTDTVSRQI